MTVLFTDRLYTLHDNGPHPESAERVRVASEHLRTSSVWNRIRTGGLREATAEELTLVHDPAYVEHLRAVISAGEISLDPDTVVCRESFRVAAHAAGAVLQAVDEVVQSPDRTAFAMIRPPGHHARPAGAMGFCLFNNVAIAAAYARKRHGIDRIAILDWDVHHGNGTQEAFWRDDSILYVSLHRFPFYPGSGRTDEIGEGPGRGYTINAPLPARMPREKYVELFRTIVEGPVAEFRPGLYLISAGFDAWKDDPVGGLNLEVEDFRTLTDIVAGIARDTAGGRIVSALEGGYDVDALARSIETHVEGLAASERGSTPLTTGRSV